jgi:hypothetical protein
MKINASKRFIPLASFNLGVLLLAIVSGSITIGTFGHSVNATSGTSIQVGRIIDDAVFTHANSMSVPQIQAFLNSKVPTCDTNGTQPSEMNNVGVPDYNGDGVIERWEWGKYHSNQTVFPCLRDYIENGINSAQIIYNTSQKYQINPQVLIVLLQKEQGLVTDTWPVNIQYKSATGYGCPDTAACDSTYYGFTNQLNWAATMFHAIEANNPNWYTPYVLGNNYVHFNPSSSCGGSTINIINRATQALYNYTPYQPNQSAKNAGYGTGDSCSAYGNLHFFLYFNDWFGNSIVANLPGCDEATNTTLACVWRMYTPQSAEYLTSSNDTRDALFVQNGYQYIGKSFFGNVTIMPGNIAVYRLTDTSGGVFLTTNKVEHDNLVAAGYKDNGIDFYAAPAGSNSGYPVYRMYNASTSAHVWTGDQSEYNQLLSYGYKSEGVAFTSIDSIHQETPPPTGKTLVYRFYIPQSYSHFWTQDLNERDSMIRAGYQYEGVAWNSSTSTDSMPVYRLFSAGLNQHLYTTDANERNSLVKDGTWSDEGIAQYVSSAPNSRPVYRLYAPTLKTHILTIDSYEKDQLVRTGGWQYEGIAWYQP